MSNRIVLKAPTVDDLERERMRSKYKGRAISFHVGMGSQYFALCLECGSSTEKSIFNPYYTKCNGCGHVWKYVEFMRENEVRNLPVYMYYEIHVPNDEELYISRWDLVYRVSFNKETPKIEKIVKDRGMLRFKYPKFTRKKLTGFIGYRTSGIHPESNLDEFDLTALLSGHSIMEKTGLKEFLENNKTNMHTVLTYMEKYQKQPQLELLMKSGFDNLVRQIVFSNREFSLNETTKASKVFSLPRPILNHLRGSYVTLDTIKALENLYGLRKDLNVNHIRYLNENGILSYHYLNILNRIFRDFNISVSSAIAYLERCDLYQAIPPGQAICIWEDYLEMIKMMGWKKADKYPKSLKLQHDLATRDYEFVKNRVLEQMWSKRREQLKNLEEKGKNFIIRLPESLEELVVESRELRHCVKSYAERLAKGVTSVFFLRKAEEPDVPYYTIEVRDGRILQVKGYCNQNLTDQDAIDFLTEWQNKNQLLGSVA